MSSRSSCDTISRRRPVVAVVGNAPELSPVAAAVDRCDHVVRCNDAAGIGGVAGHRVDDLALINCGGQMAEWLAEESVENTPAFTAARTIVLPIDPRKVDLVTPPLTSRQRAAIARDDHTQAAAARFSEYGKEVVLLPAAFFAASVAALGHAMTRRAPAPSTGYLVARWWVLAGAHVEAFGFGFEGWDGHDFAAERRWFARTERAGRLTLHPLDGDRSEDREAARASA